MPTIDRIRASAGGRIQTQIGSGRVEATPPSPFVITTAREVRRVMAAAGRFHWVYVPAILALTTFNYLLRGVKWLYYLRLIGIPVARGEAAAIFACGLSMAMTPGKVGELLKAWLLRARAGTPMAVSAPVILAERLTDGVAMLILASAGLLLYRHGWQALLLIALVAVAAVAVVQSRTLSQRILAAMEGIPVLAARAHHLLEAGAVIGKLLLKPPG